jgi:hypothetical protein
MINSKASNQRSDDNELAVREVFERLNYVVKKLDTKGANRPRRPDFLISNSAGPQMICEVKTVDSDFYSRDKEKHGIADAHISTLDDKLFAGEGKVSFKNIPIRGKAIERHLADAVDKREVLVKDEPQFADLPLLVALSFDQLAPEYLPPFDERFREVSGILTIAEDVERTKALRKLGCEAWGKHLRAQAAESDRARLAGETPKFGDDGLPPRSKDFVLVPNQTAVRPVPEDFARLCLPDAYYG